MSEVFDSYGRYYDLLYLDKNYQAETEWIKARINAHAPQAESILELGCGTGAHARELVKSGFTVLGIDQSEQMLVRARQKVSDLQDDLHTRLSFATGDVRSLRLEKKYDVALSLFHVFSYLTANRDLRRAFESAALHLKPHGLLIFDFWFGPAVLQMQPETRVRRLSDNECKITRIAEPLHNCENNVITVQYSMFIERLTDGHIHQLSENHPMRYWFLPELEDIASAWFEPLEWRAWLEDTPPSPQHWAACAVMRRKQ